MRKTLVCVTLVWVSFCSIAPNIHARSILVSAAAGNYSYYGYGGGNWQFISSELNLASQNNITVVANFSNLEQMLSYDALWLDQRGNTGAIGTLSPQELANIAAFIATGRRIVMIGESSGWWGWNNQILSLVGGHYLGESSMYTPYLYPLVNNELTANVGRLRPNIGGVASGGTQLFSDYNVYTLWGENVLTILDVGTFEDYHIDNPVWGESRNNSVWGDGRQFAHNVAAWVAFSNNRPPVAEAGPNQTVHVGLPVVLDGSGSSDHSGFNLTYQWSIDLKPAGSSAVLSNPTSVNPTFTADALGDYVVRLIVTNSSFSVSSPSTVTVSTTNSPPVADSGADQLITVVGTNFQLNGSQSYDLDGDPMNYSWTLTSPPGSLTSLIGANTINPTFYPDVYGTYVARLVVSDPWAISQPTAVTISFENVKPVADAQESQSLPVGTVAFLDGSGSSDANHNPLTYNWTITSLPTNSHSAISDTTASIASFIPDLPGTYIAQLIVNDGFVNSNPSTVQFQVFSTESAAIASATEIQAAVSSLPVLALKNANMKKTLLNKLNAAIANIDAGLYADALAQLKNDILEKMDGCATIGASDKNDWITTCPEQNQVYPLVQETIWIVEGLLAP